MIAVVTGHKHATEFDHEFSQLFTELTRLARSHGVGACYALGGNSNGEDAEDFAQECLIECWNRAQLSTFRTVQVCLIKRIAHDRLVDAWRRRGRAPCREEFEASTNELTKDPGSNGEHVDSSATPEFQGLSDKVLEILRLKHVAEWLDREIADAFGMTVDGVRSSLKRSRQKVVTKRVTQVCNLPTIQRESIDSTMQSLNRTKVLT